MHKARSGKLAWSLFGVSLNSLPEETFTAEQILHLYRTRWQIEMAFKRWKSLGCIDNLKGDCKDVLGYVTIEPADATGFVPYAASAAVRKPNASQENVITSTLTRAWSEIGSFRSGRRMSPRFTA